AEGGFAEYIKQLGANKVLRSVYGQANDPTMPFTGSYRAIFHKTNINDENNPYGYGWAIVFWGTTVYFRHWYGNETSAGYLADKTKWHRMSDQRILSGTKSPTNSVGTDGDIYIQYI